jgi:hypothetical protein
LGKPITYIAASYEGAEKALKARGLPDWLVRHQLVIAKLAAQGGFSAENSKPIREILGREPIATKQFVQDYKAAFS